MTQRLARSSRTPVLKFPPAKYAAADSTKVTSASAVSAGWEKNAENPPQPSTARPRKAAVVPTIIVNRALGVARTSAIDHSIRYPTPGADPRSNVLATLQGFRSFRIPSAVVAGLVPATPGVRAPSKQNRERRDKPGHGPGRDGMRFNTTGNRCSLVRSLGAFFRTMPFRACIAALTESASRENLIAARPSACSISFPDWRFGSRFMLAKLSRLHFFAKSALCRAVSRG